MSNDTKLIQALDDAANAIQKAIAHFSRTAKENQQ